MRSRDILEGQSCISTIWPWLFGALVLSGLREVSDQSTHLRRASLNAPAGRLKFPLFWQLRTILWHVQPWLGVERAAKPRAANFTACARVVVGRARAVRVEPRLPGPLQKFCRRAGRECIQFGYVCVIGLRRYGLALRGGARIDAVGGVVGSR